MILYLKKDFDKAKYLDILPLKCDFCYKKFFRLKRDIKCNNHYCSRKCSSSSSVRSIECFCNFCGLKIIKKLCELSNKNYCSKSCSAKFNNKKPKRTLTKKCKLCKSLIYKKQTYCKDCYLTIDKNIDNLSLYEYLKTRKNDASRYNNIRNRARFLVRQLPKICNKCGYNKHVHVCHVKPISSFDLSTKIFEVNRESNLVLLCPNCHWEFDNLNKTNTNIHSLC